MKTTTKNSKLSINYLVINVPTSNTGDLFYMSIISLICLTFYMSIIKYKIKITR